MAADGGPRQKMINMMYLVLTAMLALNVSKEILQAFVVVGEGLVMQKGNIESKNAIIYSAFEQEKQTLGDKWNESSKKEYYDKVQTIRAMSNDLVKFIEDMKVELISIAEEKSPEEAATMSAKDLVNLDNYDIPTYYFGTDDPIKVQNGSAKVSELKKKIAEYRDRLLSKEFFKDMKDTSKVKLNLNTDPQKAIGTGEVQEWEMYYFYHLPMPAALTELTKWQNNVRSAEGDMIKYQFDQITANAYKFDQIQAAIIPKSNVVFSGNDFEAEIFLAAYNSQERPEIIANGTPITEFNGAKGIYKIQASGEGTKTVSGVIKVMNPIDGTVDERPFETEYQVSKPMMTVSPDKMNVVYRGLENPISISVPGVAANQITATCSGCQAFSGSNGKYIVKPGTGNTIDISVSVKLSDGKVQSMGKAPFRVKRVPDPTIKWGGKKSSEPVNTAHIQGTSALVPIMEDFDFPVYSKILSFKVVSFPGGAYDEASVTGNIIPEGVRSKMAKTPKGKTIFFESIRVQQPDGRTVSLSASYPVR
ncbi:MAG TPA: gliding motility protein GldM [Bacteroidia bacterium]